MNKKLLLPALSLMILSTSTMTCMAADVDCPEKQKAPMGFHHKMPPKHFKHMPPRGEFKNPKFSAEHKAQMEAKKAEFAKLLETIDVNDVEKAKEILDQCPCCQPKCQKDAACKCEKDCAKDCCKDNCKCPEGKEECKK